MRRYNDGLDIEMAIIIGCMKLIDFQMKIQEYIKANQS
jgi:hypothetical protein